MEAGYEIQHIGSPDYLDNINIFAIQYNYHGLNIIETSYLHKVIVSINTVAIFKLKPKPNANTITTT